MLREYIIFVIVEVRGTIPSISRGDPSRLSAQFGLEASEPKAG